LEYHEEGFLLVLWTLHTRERIIRENSEYQGPKGESYSGVVR
jgi:hypothetical protein